MITRRPYEKVLARLYRYTDTGGYFVRAAGWTPAGIRIDSKVDLPPGTTLGQALVARDTMLEQIRQGTFDAGRELRVTPPTLSDVLDQIEARERDTWRDSTRKLNQGLWRRFGPLLPMHVAAIRYERDIRPWLVELQSRLAPNTVRITVVQLARALSYAHAIGWAPSNQAALIQLRSAPVQALPLPLPEMIEPAFTHWREADAIDAQNDRYRGWCVVFRLQLWGGFRIGEVTNLRWAWVDADNLCIHLPAELVKTGRGRTVPIDRAMLELLQTHRATYLAHGHPRYRDRAEAEVFPQAAQVPPAVVRDRFARGMEAAGLTYGADHQCTPHLLRRMAVSRMMRAGVREAVVRAIVGHRNPAQLIVYDRPFVGEMDEAREALTRADGGREGDTAPRPQKTRARRTK